MSAAVEIPLITGGVALVDEQDFARLAGYRWRELPKGYVGRYVATDAGPRYILMHREVIGAPDGVRVDHRDGIRANNRRGNLRLCTQSQNLANKRLMPGRYKGVSRATGRRKWGAYIRVHYRTIYLGTFDTPELAAHAYDTAAIAHFGEFALTNFHATPPA